MTFKKCINECGVTIEVRRTDGKWIPYEENGNKHDCPNSDYNKKKAAVTTSKGDLVGTTLYASPSTKDPDQQRVRQEITEQEASHADPLVVEVQDNLRYPRHKVALVHGNIDEITESINKVLANNDDLGYIHKGVTLLHSLEENVAWYTAVIHYEILQPREERLK